MRIHTVFNVTEAVWKVEDYPAVKALYDELARADSQWLHLRRTSSTAEVAP